MNNKVFDKVGMPNILWELQGIQKPVYKTVTDEEGNEKQVIDHLEIVEEGQHDPGRV